MVAGEAEEACLDTVNAFKSSKNIHVWSSDSDVIARLILTGNLDVEIVRFTDSRYFLQTPLQILHGIGHQALQWAEIDATKIEKKRIGTLGFALFVAWACVCEHDMKPALRGTKRHETFMPALVKVLVERDFKIDEVFRFECTNQEGECNVAD
jgi:hypothetical protein